MTLTAEEINENWNTLMGYIESHISSPRKEKLLEFYKKYENRLALMPASYKKEYHNAFPGGYVDHVNRVIECCIKVNQVWVDMGVDDTTYTTEELVFSALNHDLGKMGDEHNESYLPQDDKWRRDKLGEDYKFNDKIPFASVPDRGLFLLQSHGISYTFNEMITIQTHDGLYDEANKKYLLGWNPGQKPRTSLPFIVHQGDLMAARIEFEGEWLHKFKDKKQKEDTSQTSSPKQTIKNKALKSVGSSGLKNILDTL
jgi:hypothetical protein|tara:strand:- start:883 stop:1650 length:768 start_codon:yes stop_codon:yes gene_type:complete